MTLDELVKLCDETDEFYKDLDLSQEPNFNVMVPSYRYGETVRIAPGLSGRNLGHYPPEGTMVNLNVAKVRTWIKKMQA